MSNISIISWIHSLLELIVSLFRNCYRKFLFYSHLRKDKDYILDHCVYRNLKPLIDDIEGVRGSMCKLEDYLDIQANTTSTSPSDSCRTLHSIYEMIKDCNQYSDGYMKSYFAKHLKALITLHTDDITYNINDILLSRKEDINKKEEDIFSC